MFKFSFSFLAVAERKITTHLKAGVEEVLIKFQLIRHTVNAFFVHLDCRVEMFLESRLFFFFFR